MRLALALLLLAGCTDATNVPLETPTPLTHNPLGRDPLAEDAAGPLSPDSLTGTFEGHYSAGFEHTGFVPCADSTEAWWTEAASTLVPIPGYRDQYRLEMTPAAAAFDTAYVALTRYDGTAVTGPVVWARLRGRATPRGDAAAWRGYGHEGAYTREFAVDSVLAMSADTPSGACARPHAVRP